MKLAIIHPNFNTKAGAENVVYWLCEDLAKKRGLEITLFSVDFAEYENKLKGIEGLRINRIVVPELFKRSKIITLIFAVIYLKENLKNYDVINPHNFPASLWVGIANILTGRKLPKIIWSCNEPAKYLYKNICCKRTPENLKVLSHNLDEKLQIKFSSRIKFALKEIYKPFLRYIDRKGVQTFYKVLPISNTSGNQVKEIYGINNVSTCYLGIKGTDNSGKSEMQNDTNFFLTVSRLEGYKNISKAIEAFALLKKQNKLANIQYFIIGTGPTEKNLKELIIRSNLTEYVKMFGYVTKEFLMECYRDCMFIIHLPYDETFGLAYLEAAAFSKPSIASNHDGPAELVIHNKTGLLVDVDNTIEIAAAIEKMCQNKAEREEMGRKAYQYLNEKFVWEKYIERFLGYLSK